MKKVFFIGDSESLIAEISGLLKDGYEITDALDESVDFIFELTNFNKEIKFNILNYIEEKNANGVIVSSSVCITALEQCINAKHPERIIGCGIYPGISESKGMELSKTKFTKDKYFSEAVNLFRDFGKEVFTVPDRPGMISLRIISLIINEAYLVLQEGTSSREDIDTAMKLGTNYPFGPIEWSEKIGIELIYIILKTMNDEFGEDRYRITPLLKQKWMEGMVNSEK